MPKKHAGVTKDEKRNTWRIHTRMALPNGEIVSIDRRGFKTEREALEELEMIREQNLKDYESTERFVSWRDGCLDYWSHYCTRVKETTGFNAFRIYNRHIIQPFEGRSIEYVVKAANLQKFKKNLLDLKVTAAYVNRLLRFMRWTIEYHYQRGNVTVDEFKISNIELENVSTKNDIKKERPIWSQEEFRRFIDTFDDCDKYKVLFEVFGHLGCRVSELRGLQRKHFDENKKEIFIQQQVVSKLHNGSFAIVPPKTAKSVRRISLSDRINNLLKEYCDDMKFDSDDFLFFKKQPVGDSTIRRVMDQHAKIGLLPLIPIHSLRHSNTTWLLSNKDLSLAEIGKISERLGHQSKKVTLDIYYHLNDVSNEKILDALI